MDMNNDDTRNNPNKRQAQSSSGAPEMCSPDSFGVPDVREVVSGSSGSKNEICNVLENGTHSEDDRVPKIFVCSELPETNNCVDNDDVPYTCADNSASEKSNSCDAKDRNLPVDEGVTNSNGGSTTENRQTMADAANKNSNKSTNEVATPSKACRSKSMNIEAKISKDHDSGATRIVDQAPLSGKENQIETGHASTSKDGEDSQLAEGAHSKDSQHASSSSRFSFFRSISNILIATKWSKLRIHTPSKSHKHHGHGDERGEEDQAKHHHHDHHHLQKPEKRQRKISSKSQPGDLLLHGDREKESDSGSPDQADASRGREGLEYSDNARHSKDKGSSSAKHHHHFNPFKRHNNSSDNQQQQQQQQEQQQQQQQQPMPQPAHPPAELTERQKALLRSSWAEIGDSVGQVGVIAFIGLFETHPDVIDMFDQFRGMSLESVFSSISLKEHALRVMTTVEKFLNRIDRPEKLQKILEDLGKRHVGYRFKIEYIRIVGLQFICAMRPHVSSWTPETEQAWTVLIETMSFHMERGAVMEMQNASNC